MTFEYRDTFGHKLTTIRETDLDGQPVVTFWAHGKSARVPVRVELGRLEEVLAGARDTGRQGVMLPSRSVRTLTPSEHDRAWHAIEGAEDPDPGTILAAVLRALRINAPTVEDEQADSPRLRDAARQAAGQTPTTEPAVVAYRDPNNPRVLLCRQHGQSWHAITPVTAEDLPDGGICTFGRLSSNECGRDVLAGQPAVEQPAEAQPAEAHPPREGWRIELLDVDGWMPSGLVRPDRDLVAQYLAGRRKQRPDATFRLVRETTTWTVEETR